MSTDDPSSLQRLREALTLVGLGLDGPMLRDRPKLDTVSPDSEEFLYLVAAYAFDMARKAEYCFLATQAIIEEELDEDTLSPEARSLAATIKEHNEELDQLGEDWKARAECLEEIIRGLYEEDMEELLDRAARDGESAK